MPISSTATPPAAPPPKGPFSQRPGQHILDEFRAWVRETGRPDTWRFHEPCKPPRDQDFDELLRFEIPDNKRADVGMASCPICSPLAPKYYAGALAWFREEGVLRAIGHECSKQHFGAQRYNAAMARSKRRAAVESAQDFLLDALPQIAPLRAEVESLHVVAAYVDRHRQFLWGTIGKLACAKLGRMGAGGVLPIEVARTIDAVDAYGKATTKTEVATVATYPVAGLRFLTRKFLVLGLARNTSMALELVRAADSEAALEFICDELGEDAHLFEAESLARGALGQVEDLRSAIREARAFFAPENLKSLSNWTSDVRAGAPLHLDYNPRYPARLRVRGVNKAWRDLTIPAELRTESAA